MTILQARILDSTHLELLEPVDLPRGREITVTVSDRDETIDDERTQWHAASANGLADAYGPSEPEYSFDMLKERNPDFR